LSSASAQSQNQKSTCVKLAIGQDPKSPLNDSDNAMQETVYPHLHPQSPPIFLQVYGCVVITSIWGNERSCGSELVPQGSCWATLYALLDSFSVRRTI